MRSTLRAMPANAGIARPVVGTPLGRNVAGRAIRIGRGECRPEGGQLRRRSPMREASPGSHPAWARMAGSR